MIYKGVVSVVDPDGKKASVVSLDTNIVTPLLVVPFYLRGWLSVGTPVVYAVFDDNTGIIIQRQDGEGGI